nr:MAG TPA: hypothetical protein [Caudoviricetes sp.]
MFKSDFVARISQFFHPIVLPSRCLVKILLSETLVARWNTYRGLLSNA